MGHSTAFRAALAFSAVGSTMLVVGVIFLVVAMTSSQASIHSGSEFMLIAVGFCGMGVLCLLPSLLVFLVTFIMKRCATKPRIVKTVEMPAYHFARPALYFSQIPPEPLAKSRLHSPSGHQPEPRLHAATLPLLDQMSYPKQQRHNTQPPIAQSETSSVLMTESDIWQDGQHTGYDDDIADSLPVQEQFQDHSYISEDVPHSDRGDMDDFERDVTDGAVRDERGYRLPEYGRPPPSPPPGYDEICRPPNLHAMTLV